MQIDPFSFGIAALVVLTLLSLLNRQSLPVDPQALVKLDQRARAATTLRELDAVEADLDRFVAFEACHWKHKEAAEEVLAVIAERRRALAVAA